jgi:hypothetical protein
VKKLIAILSFILISCVTLKAQYFNERVGFTTGAADFGLNAIENDSGYLMIGATIPYKISVGIVQIDFNGTVLFQKTIADSIFTYYVGFQGSLIKLTNGGYAMYGGRVDTTLGSYVGLLYRFNGLGDTLWTKSYGDTTFFQTGRHMRQTLDGGFILLGDNGQTSASIWVIKTDSMGNVVWQQTYGGPQLEAPTHIAVCSDGGYIFSGYTESGGIVPSNGNIRITKIDSLGNVEFNKFHGKSLAEEAWCIEQTQDGGYIFGGKITSPLDNRTRPYAMKLNSLGDTVWTRAYTPPTGNGGSNWFTTIFELPNGNFMAGGWEFSTDSVTTSRYDGLIIKLKPNGDTLWHKTYRIPYMNSPSTDFLINDIRPTADGGFICGGDIYTAFPDTGSQDMWIFKIDSNGCVDTNNCWVNPLGVTEEVTQIKNKILVYPNPTNSFITVSIPNSIGKFDGYFQLIDVTGKEVLVQKINAYTTQVDVSNYPKGIYFYQVINQKERYTGKLIIN